MTLLAAILIIGGLALTIAFVGGVVFLVGMMIHSEVSHAKAHRTEAPEAAPQPTRAPVRTTGPATRAAS